MEPYNQFPEAHFVNCIPTWELNTVIIDKPVIAIKCEFYCYCYSEAPRNHKFFICKKEEGNITNLDLVNCLIDNNFHPGCDHIFLEFFDKTTESQVIAFFGS